MQTTTEIMARLLELGKTYSVVETTAANLLLTKGADITLNASGLGSLFTNAIYEFENKGRKYKLEVQFVYYKVDAIHDEQEFRIFLERFYGDSTDPVLQQSITPAYDPKRFRLSLKEEQWDSIDDILFERLEDWEKYAARAFNSTEKERQKLIVTQGTDEERAEKERLAKEEKERQRERHNEAVKQRVFEKTGITDNPKREAIFEVACDFAHMSIHLYEISEYDEPRVVDVIEKIKRCI